jgi:Uma2 family endonuclease
MNEKIENLLNSDLSLEKKREILSQNSYDPDAFPGSSAWLRSEEWRRALVDFDDDHPEIIVEIKAKKQAERNKRLEGKDILGL